MAGNEALIAGLSQVRNNIDDLREERIAAATDSIDSNVRMLGEIDTARAESLVKAAAALMAAKVLLQNAYVECGAARIQVHQYIGTIRS